jgi:hypothetical protein
MRRQITKLQLSRSISWRDEATIISLFAEVASAVVLPHVVMWDADRLGTSLTRGTAC